jgi:hypothetical protein
MFSRAPSRRGGRMTRVYLEFKLPEAIYFRRKFKLPEAIYCLSTIHEENYFSYGKFASFMISYKKKNILYEKTWENRN